MIDVDDLVIVTEDSATIKYPTSNNYLKYNVSKKFQTDSAILIINHILNSPSFFHTSSPEQPKKRKILINLLNLFTNNGLKLIRYSNELIGLNSITSIDQSSDSIELCLENLKFNNLTSSTPSQITTPTLLNTSIHKYLQDTNDNFEIIELDPFKKNCPELYPEIITHLTKSSLLILSIPELGLISGNAYHDKCFQVYKGHKMGKHSATLESGLRLVLLRISQLCRLQQKTMDVLLTIFNNGCIKVYIKIYNGFDDDNGFKCQYCPNCDYFNTTTADRTDDSTPNDTISQCDHCDNSMINSGPFYNGLLKNNDFISQLLSNSNSEQQHHDNEQVINLLTRIGSELDTPFYINPHKWVKTGKHRSIKSIMQDIEKHGYKASQTQFGNSFIRTDCPWHVLNEILI